MPKRSGLWPRIAAAGTRRRSRRPFKARGCLAEVAYIRFERLRFGKPKRVPAAASTGMSACHESDNRQRKGAAQRAALRLLTNPMFRKRHRVVFCSGQEKSHVIYPQHMAIFFIFCAAAVSKHC
ncbi:MAG: hypothetical protein IKN72_05730, partial [Clostridia bacterium]|nr:hypothetical protein [Clostridia bacterium]